MMYYQTPDGEPTSNVQRLIPNVISPQFLTDEELAAYGVARCAVVQPVLEWWQQRGARTVDTSAAPHAISWQVEDRTLAEVKAIAWDRIKAERERRQSGLMAYVFPGGIAGHVEMNDRAKADLTAQTTAAVGMIVAGIPGSLVWTSFENVTHSLTPAEMLALGFAAGQFVAAVHVESQVLREKIGAAATVAEVVAAQWGGE